MCDKVVVCKVRKKRELFLRTIRYGIKSETWINFNSLKIIGIIESFRHDSRRDRRRRGMVGERFGSF